MQRCLWASELEEDDRYKFVQNIEELDEKMLLETDFFSSHKDFEGVGFPACFKLDGYEDSLEMEP